MSAYRTWLGRPITGEETCYHCTAPIRYTDKFGIFAWRHDSGSEFCRAERNSILRATPNGEETR